MPHCGEYHEIRWSDIRFEYDEIIVSHKKTYKVKKVYYTCPGCGCISTEAEMKRAPAKWLPRIRKPTAKEPVLSG